MNTRPRTIDIVADIVAAYVGHNPVHAAELPEMIAAVRASIEGLGVPKPAEAPAVVLTPAVPVRKSIADDYLVCLDDGKRFKSLTRHLRGLGMTPDDYRAKWGLPRDYPMLAPAYAARRSEMAKAFGLGSDRRRPRQAEVPIAAGEHDASGIAPGMEPVADQTAYTAEAA